MFIESSDQRMFFRAESFDGISVRQRGMSHQVRVYLKTGASKSCKIQRKIETTYVGRQIFQCCKKLTAKRVWRCL